MVVLDRFVIGATLGAKAVTARCLASAGGADHDAAGRIDLSSLSTLGGSDSRRS
jgi:hypothetical protein